MAEQKQQVSNDEHIVSALDYGGDVISCLSSCLDLPSVMDYDLDLTVSPNNPLAALNCFQSEGFITASE